MPDITYEDVAANYQFGDLVTVAGRRAVFIEYFIVHDESRYARIIYDGRLYTEAVQTRELHRETPSDHATDSGSTVRFVDAGRDNS